MPLEVPSSPDSLPLGQMRGLQKAGSMAISILCAYFLKLKSRFLISGASATPQATPTYVPVDFVKKMTQERNQPLGRHISVVTTQAGPSRPSC